MTADHPIANAVALRDASPMRKLVSFAVLVLLAGSLSACVVRTDPRPVGSRRAALNAGARPQCKPSHHWDGQMCRHNGKGKGARKHDYFP
jgi:hypothetical protein